MGRKTGIDLTLVIPLCPFSADEWRELHSQLPELNALSLLFSRARREHTNQPGFESLLCSLFTVQQQANISIAAMTYWHDKGRAPHQTVLRADPVYLKPDQDCLYLLGSDNLEISVDEADKLVAEINKLYYDTDWELETGAANRWYISSEQEIHIKTSTLNKAFGKNIEPYLPRGEEGKEWRGLITEWQMLLHNSEVNIQREVLGKPPVNSIWIWGEGVIPPQPAGERQRWSHIWSNDALCGGLAAWANYPKSKLPASPSEWIEQITAGNHLLVFDDLRTMARVDFKSWTNALVELEAQWLQPLLGFIKSNLIASITIEVDTGMRIVATKPMLKKWWRKIRPWHEQIKFL